MITAQFVGGPQDGQSGLVERCLFVIFPDLPKDVIPFGPNDDLMKLLFPPTPKHHWYKKDPKDKRLDMCRYIYVGTKRPKARS